MSKTPGYKKTYIPFILWLIAFIVAMFAFPSFMYSLLDVPMLTRAALLITFFFVLALLYLIYQTEYVYYFTGGPSYESARDAGSARRRAYALKHIKRFGLAFGAFMLYLLLSWMFSWVSVWADIVVWVILLLAAAISTFTIQF